MYHYHLTLVILSLAQLTRRAITGELDRRLAEYHPHAANALQVADVFVNALGANVRLYSNYLRNYALTLGRLDRAIASNAALRTFLEPREVGLVRTGYYKCGPNTLLVHCAFACPVLLLYSVLLESSVTI